VGIAASERLRPSKPSHAFKSGSKLHALQTLRDFQARANPTVGQYLSPTSAKWRRGSFHPIVLAKLWCAMPARCESMPPNACALPNPPTPSKAAASCTHSKRFATSRPPPAVNIVRFVLRVLGLRGVGCGGQPGFAEGQTGLVELELCLEGLSQATPGAMRRHVERLLLRLYRLGKTARLR